MKKWWNSTIMFVYQRVCYLTVYWGHCKVTKVFQHVRRQAIPSAILAVHVPKPWTQFKYCIRGQKHVSLSIVIYCHTWSSMNFACMLVKFYISRHSMTEDPGPRYSVHFASIHGTHLCGSHFSHIYLYLYDTVKAALGWSQFSQRKGPSFIRKPGVFSEAPVCKENSQMLSLVLKYSPNWAT